MVLRKRGGGAGAGAGAEDEKMKATFENYLQLIGQHFERADTGTILGNEVFLVPRAAGELEEILTRISCSVHGHQQRRRCNCYFSITTHRLVKIKLVKLGLSNSSKV